MAYSINPSVFGNLFTLPADIADKHLKLANEVQLKVILYIFRNSAAAINPNNIALTLRLPLSEVEDALLYWANCGILNGETSLEPEKTYEESRPAKRIKAQKVMPTRAEVGRSAAENPAFKNLLDEAQFKFGRLLKVSESSTLLWLLEDQGMDISLILMLFEYAAQENHCNIGFIEKTATSWLDAGIETISDAEKHIKTLYQKRTAWRVVMRAFGLEERQPSEKELEYSNKWINEWGFTPDILKRAYDTCVDTKSKFIMSYTAKILEGWQKFGFKTVGDIEKGEAEKKSAKPKKNNYATYDIDLVEQMLNKGYGEN